MDTEHPKNTVDLGSRLHRSRGRAGRTFVASAKVTRDELNELERAATSSGKALSEWSREVLLREARFQQPDPLFTEVVAIRVLLNHVLGPVACGIPITNEQFENVLTSVRVTKRQAAQEVMQQYNTSTQNKTREEYS